jgi:UDP-N-acetylmuramate--alanine ligase
VRHIPDTGPIHFIGIGGIGMSGIAEVLCASGFSVTGSDASENANVKRLRAKGVQVYVGHVGSQVEGSAVVVTSTAIRPDNPELIAARLLHIPVMRRAEMLAELMRLRQSICVSGTHGKTTTTSLCAALLDTAEADPTVVNGGIINAYGTNARLGSGDWFVAEADESDGSFLKLPSTIAVVTNIDPEHMEHYGTFANLVTCFEQFVHHIPFYGLAILCADHPVVKDLAERVTDRRKITYGLKGGADIQATNIRMCLEGATFDVVIDPHAPMVAAKELSWHFLQDLKLPLYGEHNIQNALVVIALAIELGYGPEIIAQTLAGFGGVKRRFTRVGEVAGAVIIDDYAHHPVEIEAVLKAARQATAGEVVAVIQPHRYTRLSHLFVDFVNSLGLADQIVVCPVYSAGEPPIEGVSEDTFTKALRQAFPKKSIHQVVDGATLSAHVAGLLGATGNLKPGSLVVCMGAGSISQWAYQLPDEVSHLLASSGKTHVAS